MSVNKNIKKITVTALFCALSFLMTFVFRFKVGFLTFDLKDAIISVLSLMYGPQYGVLSAGVVAFLELISVSDTGIYGLIMNFISSSVFALSCGCIYMLKRTFKGAIFSVITAVIAVTAVMMIANIFITPFYMGVERSEVIALIPTLLLPFNLCKAIINAAALLLIYKPVTNALKRTGLVISQNEIAFKFSKKSAILSIVSILILILAVIFVTVVLKGDISLLK